MVEVDWNGSAKRIMACSSPQPASPPAPRPACHVGSPACLPAGRLVVLYDCMYAVIVAVTVVTALLVMLAAGCLLTSDSYLLPLDIATRGPGQAEHGGR